MQNLTKTQNKKTWIHKTCFRRVQMKIYLKIQTHLEKLMKKHIKLVEKCLQKAWIHDSIGIEHVFESCHK
jgi:hypothetical protein